jgi:hypothetical protein
MSLGKLLNTYPEIMDYITFQSGQRQRRQETQKDLSKDSGL